MKIVIAGREYPQPDFDRVTVWQQISFQKETGMTPKDIREMGERVQSMTQEQREDSTDALIVAGIAIWIARASAGEDVTFQQACDIPFSDVQFVAEPGDEESPDPRPAPPAIGRGVASRPLPADRLKKKTSKKASSVA